ncbi:Alpha/Beta hydrolase protein [Aspergillus pseudoustus]|uniref:Carboxylic ester hydrolase n=1 Tax=Aspergillus pseudoustus TaxID=1810923 RepID=A0ABR4I878_9EURO
MRSRLITVAVTLASFLSSGANARHKHNSAHHEFPTVEAPAGSIMGQSTSGIETFAGIPFAHPPIGQLRLRPPVRLQERLHFFNATGPAAYCPQITLSAEAQSTVDNAIGTGIITLPNIVGQEDCLTITIKRPMGVKEGHKLPVLFWIYGGGFQTGGTEQFNGSLFTSYANELNQPFIFVAVNYRLGGFGFLAGKEILVDGAANLGILDQRMGLEWVADNIASFGGDPDKVTIWGESAGSLSVAIQMALYDGDNTYKEKPLFRGAIMDSGSVMPAEAVDSAKGQDIYDQVTAAAGCAGLNSLQCLRGLDFETFRRAANSVPLDFSYTSISNSYMPRPDGRTITESTDVLFKTGRYSAVPMINGIQEDEGTLFMIFPRNITTTNALANYLSEYVFEKASDSQLHQLVDLYSPQPDAGSPYRTGNRGELYPGFKRNAALAGDLLFILQRRYQLAQATALNPNVPAWSYMGSYGHGTPGILGTSHASDLPHFFGGVPANYATYAMRRYYTNFIAHLDPNVCYQCDNSDLVKWPEWGATKQLLQFNANSSDLIDDDFRDDAYKFISAHTSVLRF